MFRLEEIGDPVEGVVVDKNRAKQRLFRFDIMGRQPKCGIGSREAGSSGEIFNCGHKGFRPEPGSRGQRAGRRISSRHALLVPRRRGKIEGILDLAALVPLSTRMKISIKNSWTGRALKFCQTFRKSGTCEI